jgi:hypothetical protein
MMTTLNGFDANEVDPKFALDPIPAGKYLAAISESEFKPTKNGTGHYLQLTVQVIEGEYKDRLVWTRLNLDNPNATAVKLARAELSAICRAVRVMTPKDTVELHDLPLIITVTHKKRNDNGELANVVKAYECKDGAAPRRPTAAASGSTPPWERPATAVNHAPA